MPSIDPQTVEIFIYTQREGALGAVGHDLKLRAVASKIHSSADAVEVEVPADSLRVEACIVDGAEKSVSVVDRKVIERNLAKDVLDTKRHKTLRYTGNVHRDGDDAFEIDGQLVLKGVEHPLRFELSKMGGRWVGTAELDQRCWGIAPYTTFLGALRIKPHVRVEVRGPLDIL